MGAMMAKLLRHTEINRTPPLHVSNRLALDLTHSNAHTVIELEDVSSSNNSTPNTERDRNARPSAIEDLNLPPIPPQPPITPQPPILPQPPYNPMSPTFRQPHFLGNNNYQRQPSITQL